MIVIINDWFLNTVNFKSDYFLLNTYTAKGALTNDVI